MVTIDICYLPRLKKKKLFYPQSRRKRLSYPYAIPVSEVSKKYSVARKTVYAWIKRYKKGNLAPLYIKGKKHPAAIYPKAYSYINRWIVAHPGWGCRTMSAKLKEKGINLSHVQVNKLLNRIGAENFDRRINYARNFAGPGRSSGSMSGA